MLKYSEPLRRRWRVGTCSFLRTLPYFAHLSEDELRRVRKATTELSLGKGEVVLLEGEPCRGLYAVRKGQVRVFKSSPSGREQFLFIAGPGETFNDAPVFDGGPNLASVVTRERSVICLIPKAVLLSLIGGCPAGVGATKVLAGRLRDMAGLVENLALTSVTGRLGKLLLDVAVEMGGPAPIRSLTQDDMASMIGSVRDVVNRALRHLAKTGAIEFEGRRILVVDPDKLTDIVRMSDKSRGRAH